MNINNLYSYKTYPRIEKNGTRYYDVGCKNLLPSVTTVLSKTSDKSAIAEWRERVGEVEADRITKEASDIGERLHNNLENYILRGEEPTGRLLEKALTNLIIKKGLSKVDEVWGSEVMLYSKDLYAGTADLVGVFNGKPAIMDFKNARSLRKREWIEDYFLQLASYAASHDEMYKTDISTGVIMMAVRSGEYREYVIEDDEFIHYRRKWYDRLYEYYSEHEFKRN